MPEGVEPALGYAKLLEKRVKFSLPYKAVIPWRALARREQEPQRVRAPGSQKRAQMFDQMGRYWEPTIPAAGLHCLELSPPHTLPDVDDAIAEIKIIDTQPANLSTANAGLGEDHVKGTVRFVSRGDHVLDLLE
jgi:hypothetical protein